MFGSWLVACVSESFWFACLADAPGGIAGTGVPVQRAASPGVAPAESSSPRTKAASIIAIGNGNTAAAAGRA